MIRSRNLHVATVMYYRRAALCYIHLLVEMAKLRFNRQGIHTVEERGGVEFLVISKVSNNR